MAHALRRRGLPPVDDLDALHLAGAELERRLPALRDADLEAPSACPGWSVHDLVNHVIGGGHRYLLLVQGAAAHLLEHGLPLVEELRGAGLYADDKSAPGGAGDPVAELLRLTGRG